jgi:GNAT superfamily N-acetyltransferase
VYRFLYWKNESTNCGVLQIVVNANGPCYAENIFVDRKYRRQGIATRLYDEADAFLKRKGRGPLVPSSNLREDGRAFWRARLPGSI